MSLQVILRIIGIAALVVALLFAILAVHYFLTNNIRAVMDDLSGKARAAGVAGARRAIASDQRRSAPARGRTVAPAEKSDAAPEPAQAAVEPAAQEPVFIDEDDMGTVVVDFDFGAAQAEGQPAGFEGAPSSASGSEPAAGTVAFRVIRTIMLCDSDKIIAASEGISQ